MKDDNVRKLVMALRSKPKPQGPVWLEGDKVLFRPQRGAPRRGVIKFDFEHREGFCLVHLQGDPYSVYVSENQLEKVSEKMETKPRMTRKTTRKSRATNEHGLDVTAEKPDKARRGLPPGKKAADTKKTATKASAPRKATAKTSPALATNGDNPFRPQSNSWHYTEALKKGGKRHILVRNLLKRVDVHPWNAEQTYTDVHMEVDKRLMMVAKRLENEGWTVERRGRGSESFVQISPPSGRKVAKRTTKR